MSTKTIAVLDDAELQDGQMKEVAFENGNVLLSRLGDKIHATSAYCTHYGAPLSTGVLSSDGRVVCPWHGACFNVCTGDIEDAPAPNALHSFKAHVDDGKIHVTANPIHTLQANKSRPPKLLSSGTEAVGKDLVIVGGGSGAFHAVESLREHGYKHPITIISKETYAPIDRTMLSKTLMTDVSKLEWRTAAELKIKYGTTIRLGSEVTSIDLIKKEVILDNGKDSISYEKLILAPGGTPRILPVEGAQLQNVYTFRTIDDAKKVDAAAKEGKRMVVIGSSFISMEIVITLKRKLASVDVIGMENHPFEAILGTEIGAGLQKYHESQGVKFHMASKVEKIVPQEGNPALAGGVVVNGTTIPADFVIMGVGVAPATSFLKGSGIQIEQDGGVKVDEYLRVQSGSDTNDVYAIGILVIFFCFHPRELMLLQQAISRSILRFLGAIRGLNIGMLRGTMEEQLERLFQETHSRSSRFPSFGVLEVCGIVVLDMGTTMSTSKEMPRSRSLSRIMARTERPWLWPQWQMTLLSASPPSY